MAAVKNVSRDPLTTPNQSCKVVDCQPKAADDFGAEDLLIAVAEPASGMVASDHPDQLAQAISPWPSSVKYKNEHLPHSGKNAPQFAKMPLFAS